MTTHTENTATVTHPVETVHATLRDRGYWEFETAHLTEEPGEVASFTDGETVTVVLNELLPAASLPNAVRSMVPQGLKTVRTVTVGPLTDGTAEGTTATEITGAPVAFSADTTLRGEGDSTTLTARSEVTVKIPLMGSKIEGKIAGALGEVVEGQAALIARYIAGER
ncbi:DUF2505 domain-containing protein [Corynebacterium bovis]|uniref:DUF2505 domain-containing protein n=2 Tax=Corynebacterium bovis TaxID=36808 RepID=A0A3R8PL35_9CORY|nr:DUF2505 domain-containing protein [Corynebacterium bovis]MBB3116592.1 endonuclease YncB(thermonuclease family) [Corynebacterium bovis DSM 20582 = CIP 54.80]MDK8510820.1 DUF2505 domain-containing protein [Corynebacterium bovis]QQC47154.1 DUF2505 domain-containing protein [Corynebacterium bovis]RRO83326.1 DUF2505 domain-containing protein [Corynebacterium bovis]RRO84892.1 DUF2505 domain-containing protein [Corynebacterium bovis]